MEEKTFKALIVTESGEKQFTRKIGEKTIADLPGGEVLVRIKYSSLNYKDALSASGNRGVTRNYPHTPGIDAAGRVERSEVDGINPGDEVIVTSYDLGMNTSGGFGQYIRVPAEWVVKLPSKMTAKESMIFGTAGFTAGMSVHMLIQSVASQDGEILVTGASGGVGSMAVAILAKLGFQVVAVSGKPEAANFLASLGAQKTIARDEATDTSGRPLLKSRWAGVIDTVGGEILATAVKTTNPWGIVTCCGNVASPDLPLNVFPFILRGVKLVGIDSQNCPMALRSEIWQRLARDWKPAQLDSIHREIGLAQLDDYIGRILKGRTKGRILVNLEKG
jgi:putative YhdH/YhfP family quinone oxidoreductase